MFKYILLPLILGLSITQSCGTDVEVQVSDSRQVTSSITAEQICKGILVSTRLVALPSESIPESSLRRWSRESVIASLYHYKVDMLKSSDMVCDMNQAKAWYAKAALAGEPYALYSLGIIFIKREKQEALGRILIQAAADKNYYDARVHLGLEKQDF